MYYAGAPTPSLNAKDIENQEKTRMGFIMDDKDTNAVEDPQITVSDNNQSGKAIIKEPSK